MFIQETLKRFYRQSIKDAEDRHKTAAHLGDLAPLIWIYKQYKDLSESSKGQFEKRHNLNDKELRRFMNDAEEICE